MPIIEARSEHPYAPYIPKGATRLIVGTIPPYRFCVKPQVLLDGDVDFYYGSRDNCFWELICEVAKGKADLSNENTENAIEQRKALLGSLKTGITDIVRSCVHKDGKSDDNSLMDIEQKPLAELLKEHLDIDTLLYTSNFLVSQINKIADKSRHENWTRGPRGKEGAVLIGGKKYGVVVLYSPSPLALRGLGKGGCEKRRVQYTRVFMPS